MTPPNHLRRRLLSILALAALLFLTACPLPAPAQIPSGYVQTTATVPALANGSFGASWTNLSSSPQLALLGCVSTFQQTVSGSLNANGSFSVLLADTSQICPSPSTWTFNLTFACPAGTPASSFQVQVAVVGGGGTEDISSQIIAALPSTYCSGGGGGSSSVKVNGSPVSSPNFNGLVPAAPGGGTNCLWQVSGPSVSCYLPSSAYPGVTSPGTGGMAGNPGSGQTWEIFPNGTINGTAFQVSGNPFGTANLADWTDAGVTNGYVPIWNSSTSKWTPGPQSGGYTFPITYTCTGTASTDLAAINGYLATPGTYLYLDSQSHTCATNGQIVMFSGDTLNFKGQNLASSLASTASVMPQFSITNNAVISPTTISRTCTLAPGSTVVTGCSGAAFTSSPYTGAPYGDMEQSFSCPGAFAAGIPLQTSIAQINSATSITLADSTGAGITAGNFSCTEQIRDHDIHVVGGNITMTGNSASGQLPFELGLGHANNVTVEGGNWNLVDNTGSWHMVFWDVNRVTGKDFNCRAGDTAYGQDCIDVAGPAREVDLHNIVADEEDDTIALWSGTYVPTYSAPFLNTFGNIQGVSVHNIQGNGPVGLHIYSPSAVNASGTMQSGTVTDVVADTIIGQPFSSSGASAFGFATGVVVQCQEISASDCGTASYVDRLRFSHIIGTSVSGSVGANRVRIGTSTNVNQFYSGIDISDVGPDNSTYGGDVGAITVQTPASLSYTTNVSYLSVHDTAYTGNHGLFGISNTNATVSYSFFDNPIAANYQWSTVVPTNTQVGYLFSYALTPYVGAKTYAGSGTPTDTCSATSYTWAIEINATPVAYQCSNATGSYAWNVLGGSGGSGTMSDGSGSSTAGYFPATTSTAHTYSVDTNFDDGHTTANTFTVNEAFAVNCPSCASQANLTYNSGHAPSPGSSTTAEWAPSTAGLFMISEAGGAFAEACTSTNGVCASPVSTIISSGAITVTAQNTYVYCTGNCTITPLAPALNVQLCVRNGYDTDAVVTLAALGSGKSYELIDHTTLGTPNHTVVSGGGGYDESCWLGVSTTAYSNWNSSGTWTD